MQATIAYDVPELQSLDDNKVQNFTGKCFVCDDEVRSDDLSTQPSNNLTAILKQSCGIQASGTSAQLCVTCLSQIELLQQATQAQSSLLQKAQNKIKNGGNGLQLAASLDLFRSGNGCNLPPLANESLQGKTDDDNNDGEFSLQITNITGGVAESCNFEETVSAEECYKTVSTDTADLVKEEVLLDCEVIYESVDVDRFDELFNIKSELKGAAQTPNDSHPNIKQGPEETLVMNQQALTYDLNTCNSEFNVTRWLPGASASSSDSYCYGDTSSVGSKDVPTQPANGWKCPMCEKRYDCNSDLVSHVHTGHSETKGGDGMDCPFCKKQFSTYTQLEDHIVQLHGDGSQSCQGCCQVFQRASQLRRHQQYCGEYKQYQQRQSKDLEDQSDNENSDTERISLENELKISQQSNHSDAQIEEVERESEDTRPLKKPQCQCPRCDVKFDSLSLVMHHQLECVGLNRTEKIFTDAAYRCFGCDQVYREDKTFRDHIDKCTALADPTVSENSIKPTTLCNEQRIHTKSLEGASQQDLLEAKDQDSSSTSVKPNSCKTEAMISPKAEPGTTEFKCEICLISFAFKSLKDFHMSIHTEAEDNPYKCEGCSAGFVCELYKKKHMEQCGRVDRSVTPADLSHEKQGQGIESSEKSVAEADVKIEPLAPDLGTLQCVNCQVVFKSQSDMNQHKLNCDEMACYYCLTEFSSYEGLKNHIVTVHQSPSNEDIPRCQGCNAHYSSHEELQSHMIKCAKYSSLKDNGRGAAIRFKPFRCSNCSIRFAYFGELSDHLAKCAGSDNPEELTIGNDKKVIANKSGSVRKGVQECDICHVVFFKTKQYVTHLEGHKFSSSKAMVCSGCGWGTNHYKSLVQHMKICQLFEEKLSNEEEKPGRCPCCMVTYSGYKVLASHITNIHLPPPNSGLTTLRCEGCYGYLSNNSALSQHYDRCEAHYRKMSSPKPELTCGICLSTLYNSNGLASHYESFHNLTKDSLKCFFCQEKFPFISQLAKHAASCSIFHYYLSLNSAQSALIMDVSDVPDDNSSDTTKDNDTESAISTDEVFSFLVKTDVGFACNVCSARGSRAFVLQHAFCHSETAMKSRTDRCERCGGGFVSKCAVKTHMKICRPYQAKQDQDTESCISDKNEVLLDAVLKLSELPGNVEVPVDNDGEDNPNCIFDTKSDIYSDHQYGRSLWNEADQKANEVIEPCNAETEDEDEVDDYKCLNCCIKFAEEKSFLLHVASHEVTSILRCFLCGLRFKVAADICMHMLNEHKLFLTTGVKPEGSDSKFMDVQLKDEAYVSVTKLERLKRAASGPTLTESISLSPTSVDEPLQISIDSKKPLRKFFHDKLTGNKCPLCKRTFKSTAILRKHYGIHDGFYPYVCSTCGLGFAKLQALKKHRASSHQSKGSAPLMCNRCDGKFATKFKLSKHMELCVCTRHQSSPQCFLCTKRFDSWLSLMGHITSHKNRCSFCDLQTQSARERVDHMLSCSKNTLSKFKGKTGNHQQASGSSFRKSVSAPVFTDEKAPTTTSPKKSPAKKVKLKCSHCCFETFIRKSLKNHELQHEKAEYRCRVCGGKFNSLYAKNRHMLREHGSSTLIIKASASKKASHNEKKPPTETCDPDPSPSSAASATTTAVFFACQTCHQCFRNKEEKDNHESSAHGTSCGIKAFCCKLCDKRFPSKFARRRHMQKFHTGNAAPTSNVCCHICNKPFFSNFAKLQHLKKIHKVTDNESLNVSSEHKKLRKCKYCNEFFEHKSDLKAHKQERHKDVQDNDEEQRQHSIVTFHLDRDNLPTLSTMQSAEKRRRCPQCSASFLRKSELKTHMKENHSVVPLTSTTVNSSHIIPHHVDVIVSSANSESVPNTSTTMANAVPNQSAATENSPAKPQPIKKRLRQCKDCGQIFMEKADLKAHRKAVHKKKGADDKAEAVFALSDNSIRVADSKAPAATGMANGVSHDKKRESSTSQANSESAPSAKRLKLDTGVSGDAGDIIVLSNVSTQPNGADSKAFKCEVCNKAFKMRMSLNQHMNKSHPSNR